MMQTLSKACFLLNRYVLACNFLFLSYHVGTLKSRFLALQSKVYGEFFCFHHFSGVGAITAPFQGVKASCILFACRFRTLNEISISSFPQVNERNRDKKILKSSNFLHKFGKIEKKFSFLHVRSPNTKAEITLKNDVIAIGSSGRGYYEHQNKICSPLIIPYAVALDIDGVLMRGHRPLEGAKEAICSLQQHSVPFILLTNGGGMSEEEKAVEVSRKLNVQIDADQVQLSHSPMKCLAKHYADKPVLVVGSKDIVGVARACGFENFITSENYLFQNPQTLPWRTTSFLQRFPKLEKPHAAFILHDPTDWLLDMQIILDRVIESDDKPFQIYSSNSDLVYSSDHLLPRLSQGAFTTALKHIYKKLTDKDLEIVCFGKPFLKTYSFAEELLKKRVRNGHHLANASPKWSSDTIDRRMQRNENSIHFQMNVEKFPSSCPFSQNEAFSNISSASASFYLKPIRFCEIFAIGDNPQVDIRGANNAGHPWISLLVRTGVFNGADNDALDPAHFVFDDVNAAIQYILQRRE